MKHDLNWWLESQILTEQVENVIETTARNIPIRLKVSSDQGYPISTRQVASDLPQTLDGKLNLGLGNTAVGLLVMIGFWKKINDESCRDLDYVSCMLQEALYLVTTRNESVYEITEADKVELGKDDIREISKTVLLYHSLLREDELPLPSRILTKASCPSYIFGHFRPKKTFNFFIAMCYGLEVAETLLERCGHHPLTVAVMGKALRKELRPEKWEKAIANLSILEAMPTDSKRLFTALAALSWVEPIPELSRSTLVGSWAGKFVLSHNGKTNDSVRMLLTNSSSEENAFISPWLFIFGKEPVKRVSKQKIELSLTHLQEKQAVVTLEAITQALEVGISISEFEDSRLGSARCSDPRLQESY
ncbi:UNVERIFIED_CONTAM: hypothetical protein Sangu_0104900 [Sesamum angustifolium]|uniref:Uncharacterized protein n=1 Tax=Sesamum angustifolium TaxID=2727405 RepID=A0AAW2RJV1_9LAMI